MPTIFREGPHRFFFYSADRGEPVHVHVHRDDCLAKFWLDPVRLAESVGFSRRELSVIEGLVAEHLQQIREAWHDFFSH